MEVTEIMEGFLLIQSFRCEDELSFPQPKKSWCLNLNTENDFFFSSHWNPSFYPRGIPLFAPHHPPPSPPYVGFVGLYTTPPDFPQPSEARYAFWWKPLEANLKENMRWALCRQFPWLGSQLKQPVKLKNAKCGKRMRTPSSCARTKLNGELEWTLCEWNTAIESTSWGSVIKSTCVTLC